MYEHRFAVLIRKMRWIFLHTGHSTAQASHDRCIVFVHHLKDNNAGFMMLTILVLIITSVLINVTSDLRSGGQLSFVRIVSDKEHYDGNDKLLESF